MQALIYAAGFGTRLRPLTDDLPKALVPFRASPLLFWIITNLIKQGIEEIVINTHYLAEKIEVFLQDYSFNIPISTSFESEILGTGGGLYKTKRVWGEKPILICNADILCDIDLLQFKAHQLKSQSAICLAINHVPASSMLLIDEDGILCGREKEGKKSVYLQPQGSLQKVGFSGFHLFDPEILKIPVKRVEFSIIDQYFLLIQQGVKINTWDIGQGFWLDVGTPGALKKAEKEYPG
ncbi:MAG: NTP transferase domain-containing protein [Proteobacteria bacterium]|nr:NTP transferase domain-containing protein [Pseudomonadota bacterium]